MADTQQPKICDTSSNESNTNMGNLLATFGLNKSGEGSLTPTIERRRVDWSTMKLVVDRQSRTVSSTNLNNILFSRR